MTVKAAFLPIAALLLVVSPWGAAVEADTRAGAAAYLPPSGIQVQASGTRIGDIQVGGFRVNGIQMSGSQVSGTHISGAVGGGQASAEAVIGGGDGVIVLQDDRVVVEEGRLSLNGISYGRVGPHSVVRFVVTGGTKRLFVDGVERGPR